MKAPVRWAPLALGAFLIFTFFRLDFILSYGARFGRQLYWLSREELAFWAAHLLLMLPGAALVSIGLAGPLTPVLRALVTGFQRLDGRGRLAAAAAFGVLLFALAQLGRQLLLLDLPVTDDENMVLFGARMVARGDLHVPVLQPPDAYTDLFLYFRDGHVSAIDFPGGVLFRAASLLTGLGPVLYALAAAAAGVAVVGAALRFTSLPAALGAGLIWVCSPMVFSLSLTTHTQAVSRFFLALTMYLAARTLAPRPGERSARAALGMGLCAGGAFLSRPIETGMLLLPLALWLLLRAVRGGADERRVLLMALAGLVPALVVFGWYNHGVTGRFLVQARFAPEARPNEGAVLTLWQRLPVHLCFETLMLSIWFLGPIGIGLALVGTRPAQPLSVALAVGLLLDLSITLTHQFTGVHVVGPIHFSETPVFLTLLAALGLERLFAGLRARGIPGAAPAWVLLGTVLLGYGAFDAIHGRTLRSQAEAQQYPQDELARRDIHHAVVLADTLATLYQRHPTGSWVQQFPHPDPYLRDDVIFARADADLRALRARFPDRRFYRLRISRTGPAVSIDPL